VLSSQPSLPPSVPSSVVLPVLSLREPRSRRIPDSPNSSPIFGPLAYPGSPSAAPFIAGPGGFLQGVESGDYDEEGGGYMPVSPLPLSPYQPVSPSWPSSPSAAAVHSGGGGGDGGGSSPVEPEASSPVEEEGGGGSSPVEEDVEEVVPEAQEE